MIYAERISEFGLNLKLGQIPDELQMRVKGSILDTIGVGLAASRLDFADMVRGYVLDQGGQGQATIFGCDTRVPAAQAAFVNGSLAHCLDFDDSHGPSRTHPSACVVPAVLALGEQKGSSGIEILTATIAGLETMIRTAMAGTSTDTGNGFTEGFHQRGIHPTILCGIFGGTMAASRLLGLDVQHTSWAFGLAGGMACGSFEYITEGTWGKRIGPGWAAQAALTAANLAKRGVSGPRTIFEGKAGIFRSRLREGHFNLGHLVDGLGERWQALAMGIKRYPCCHRTHAPVQQALALSTQNKIRPADIASVECVVDRNAVALVCEPWKEKLVPQTGYAAKFSLPYCVAAALVKGALPMRQFEVDALGDPLVADLMARITYRVDETLDPVEWPGGVKISTKDGRTYQSIKTKDAFAGWSEIVDKFNEYAAPVLGADSAASIVEAVASFEELSDIRSLLRMVGCAKH